MKRYHIGHRKIAGESGGLDRSVADQFITEKLPGLIKNYLPADIFNADETALYLETMPDRTLHFRGTNCNGTKVRKDRVTMMVCSNMDGSEKKDFLIIGKSAKPRCFKNVDLNKLSVKYEANKNAWMTTQVMTKYLVDWDQVLKAADRKILLFLDNCSAHPPRLQSELTNIELAFFPPNMTPFLQPMDMGVISNIKFYYRLKMVRFLMSHIGNENRPKVSLLDTINWVSEIWKTNVKSETISNCFKKAGFFKALEIVQSDNLSLNEYENIEYLETESEEIPEQDINEWNGLVNRLGVEFTIEEAVTMEDGLSTSELPVIELPVIVNMDELRVIDVQQETDQHSILISDDFPVPETNEDSGFAEDTPYSEPRKVFSALHIIDDELLLLNEVPSEINTAFSTLKDFFSQIYE